MGPVPARVVSGYLYRRITVYSTRLTAAAINSSGNTNIGLRWNEATAGWTPACFEQHTIRGIRKMTMSCSLALILMLTLALGRFRPILLTWRAPPLKNARSAIGSIRITVEMNRLLWYYIAVFVQYAAQNGARTYAIK